MHTEKPSERTLLLRGTFASATGSLVTVVATLLAGTLLARLLPAAAVGRFYLFLALVAGGTTVANLGIPLVAGRLTVNALGGGNAATVASIAKRSVQLTLASSAALACVALIPPVADLLNRVFQASGNWSVALALGPLIAATAVARLLAELQRAHRRIGLAVLLQSGLAFSLFSLLIGTLWLGGMEMTLGVAVLSMIAASVASALVGTWRLRLRDSGRGAARSSSPGTSMVRRGLPLLSAAVAQFASSQGLLWVLAAVVAPESVALYALSNKLAILVSQPLALINAAVAPALAETATAADRKRQRGIAQGSATAAGLVGIPAVLVLLLAGGPILGLLFGDFYRQGYPVLALLAAGQLANMLAGPCGLVLVMAGHERAEGIITTSVSLAVLAAAVPVTHLYGPVGLAAVVAGGILLQNALRLVAARRLVGVWTVANPASIRSVLALRSEIRSAVSLRRRPS